MGCNGFKHEKDSKIHVVVDEDSMTLSITIRPGDEHDSNVELIGGL